MAITGDSDATASNDITSIFAKLCNHELLRFFESGGRSSCDWKYHLDHFVHMRFGTLYESRCSQYPKSYRSKANGEGACAVLSESNNAYADGIG